MRSKAELLALSPQSLIGLFTECGGGVRRWRYRYLRSPSFVCDLLDFDFKNPSSLVDEKFEKISTRPRG
jgi:hypothetical protein